MSLEGWLKQSVKDICDLGRGRVISTQEIELHTGIYPVFSSQSQDKGEMGKIDTYDFEGEYITWTTDGAYAGTVFYRTGKFNCTNVCGTLKAKNRQLSMKFLAYKLSSLTKNYVSYVGNPKLMNNVMANIELSLPESQAEQTQIATILSTILMQDLLTKGIDENGNIRSEETHEFKDSPLGRIPVEWEVKKIEQKLERIIDYRGQTPKKVTEGIPLLTAKNVRDGFIEKEPQEFIADSAYNSWMSRGIPEVGDVLFTTEAPMGNVASIPNYRIALAQRLLTLCPKINELSQDFLFWILHWKRSKERIELLTSGSTVVGIKQSVFRKVIFAFPSYNEQERIYAVLNSHDEINKNEKHKLKKLQRLKTGLMQDLLTGKVRVTDLLNQKAAAN